MGLIDALYLWTGRVLTYGAFVLFLWAIVDCAVRKQAAFPAADKLTKPAWLAIVLVAGGLGAITAFFTSVLNPITLIAFVATMVYLADVRPAVREISSR